MNVDVLEGAPAYHSSPTGARVRHDSHPTRNTQNIPRAEHPTAAGPQHAVLAKRRVMRKGNKRPTVVFLP